MGTRKVLMDGYVSARIRDSWLCNKPLPKKQLSLLVKLFPTLIASDILQLSFWNEW